MTYFAVFLKKTNKQIRVITCVRQDGSPATREAFKLAETMAKAFADEQAKAGYHCVVEMFPDHCDIGTLIHDTEKGNAE